MEASARLVGRAAGEIAVQPEKPLGDDDMQIDLTEGVEGSTPRKARTDDRGAVNASPPASVKSGGGGGASDDEGQGDGEGVVKCGPLGELHDGCTGGARRFVVKGVAVPAVLLGEGDARPNHLVPLGTVID